MARLQKLNGMHEVLPHAAPTWRRVEEAVIAALERYAYDEIRLPLLEPTAVFERSAGDSSDIVQKQMYTFSDRGGDSVTLRPEGTAGCVRACIENALVRSPHRLWYHGQMFRHERTQKGRAREFVQIGVEAIGFAEPATEAELIAMMWDVFGVLGVRDHIRLELNSIGDVADRATYRDALVAYLMPHRDALDEDSQRRLQTNPLRIFDSKVESTRALMAGAPRLANSLGEAARAHHVALTELLSALSIPYTTNDLLVRGLDYYNRTVFEWTTESLGAQGTVCAGGRYDGLVEQLGGPAVPAAGFAVGVDRLVMLAAGVSEGNGAPAAIDAYVIVAAKELLGQAMAMVTELRRAVPGVRIRQDVTGGSFKAQLRRADASGARLALIAGADELRASAMGVKWLRADRPQEVCTLPVVAGHLARSDEQ